MGHLLRNLLANDIHARRCLTVAASGSAKRRTQFHGRLRNLLVVVRAAVSYAHRRRSGNASLRDSDGETLPRLCRSVLRARGRCRSRLASAGAT